MTKKYIHIADLIYKDKIGSATEEEQRELREWLDESDFNRQDAYKKTKYHFDFDFFFAKYWQKI